MEKGWSEEMDRREKDDVEAFGGLWGRLRGVTEKRMPGVRHK